MNARDNTAKAILKGATPLAVSQHCEGYKTFCTCAVLAFYGIEKESFRFCQWVKDMVRILNRDGFSAKVIHTKKGIKGKPVYSLPSLVGPGFYLVQTYAHVCLAYVDNSGKLSFPVETNTPHGKKNYRKIITLHRITAKKTK